MVVTSDTIPTEAACSLVSVILSVTVSISGQWFDGIVSAGDWVITIVMLGGDGENNT